MRGSRHGPPRRLPLTEAAKRHPADQLAGCEGKRLYASEELAHAHMLTVPAADREGLRPYECPDCLAGWHLGHAKKAKGKK